MFSICLADTNMFAHAMVHSHDVQESGAKVHNTNIMHQGSLLDN